jgi:O-antigen ligase
LERRVVHWQELLLKVDLNPLWGVGWGQAPLLSQNCLLQPFAFPHHSLLQLWLEGGLVWVILVWAAGGVALVALWPVRARGAPFWGWLGGLIVLGYQGSLWDFGWLYGVSVTGVSVFRIGLAENRQGTKISS